MLEAEFNFIKECITHLEKENLKTSKETVGWYLDHSLKVINNVYGALKESKSKEYQKKMNVLRTITFVLGVFLEEKQNLQKEFYLQK